MLAAAPTGHLPLLSAASLGERAPLLALLPRRYSPSPRPLPAPPAPPQQGEQQEPVASSASSPKRLAEPRRRPQADAAMALGDDWKVIPHQSLMDDLRGRYGDSSVTLEY